MTRQRGSRGHLGELGISVAKGIGRIDELVELSEKDATLPDAIRGAAKVLGGEIEDLDKSLNDLGTEIATVQEASEMSRLLLKVPGAGKLIATVIVASVPDLQKGTRFCAWLGLTPRQNSSGGKPKLEHFHGWRR